MFFSFLFLFFLLSRFVFLFGPVLRNWTFKTSFFPSFFFFSFFFSFSCALSPCSGLPPTMPPLLRIQSYVPVFFSFKPGLGQSRALHASPTARSFAFLMPAFFVHSTSFVPILFKVNVVCVFNCELKSRLLLVILWLVFHAVTNGRFLVYVYSYSSSLLLLLLLSPFVISSAVSYTHLRAHET